MTDKKYTPVNLSFTIKRRERVFNYMGLLVSG